MTTAQTTNNIDPRFAEAILNEPHFIAQLTEMPDRVLSKKLKNVRQQLQMAHEKKLTSALETLLVWERQIIEARFLKNDFDDAPARKQKKDTVPLFEKTATVQVENSSSLPAPEETSGTSKQLALF